MTMTATGRELHRQYEEADQHTQMLVDDCCNAVCAELQAVGIKPANNDTAEELVGAIYLYVSKSRDVDAGIVRHGEHIAHLAAREEDPTRKTSSRYCGACRDWFKPAPLSAVSR